jgi:tetratricopeptide (TPR) repeat protein
MKKRPPAMGSTRDMLSLARWLAIAAAIVLCVPAVLAIGGGTARLVGKVTDESGNPVGGISLRFVPADESGNPERTLKVSKKGTFSHSFFPIGEYTVKLADGSKGFIKSMTYVVRDDAGLEVDHKTMQAHPEKGLPPFKVGLGRKVELDLVLSSEQERKELAQKVELSEASGALKKIKELYDAGDMDGVVKEAQDLLEEKPDLGLAHYLLGLAQSNLGESAAAVASLEKAVKLSPEQQGIAGALGTALLQRARELDQSGDAAGAKAAYAQAADALQEEIDRFGPSAAYLANRAAALQGMNDAAKLIPALKALVEADPQNLDAWMQLITSETQAGMLDDARARVDRAPTTRPKELAGVVYNLAAAYFNDGRMDEAIAVANQAHELDPDLVSVYHLLGLAYLSKDDRPAAIRNFEKIVEIAPDDPVAESARQILEKLHH